MASTATQLTPRIISQFTDTRQGCSSDNSHLVAGTLRPRGHLLLPSVEKRHFTPSFLSGGGGGGGGFTPFRVSYSIYLWEGPDIVL